MHSRPLQRHTSHQTLNFCFETDVIRFDNSAMLKSKTLSYLIEILEPGDEDLFEDSAEDNQ